MPSDICLKAACQTQVAEIQDEAAKTVLLRHVDRSWGPGLELGARGAGCTRMGAGSSELGGTRIGGWHARLIRARYEWLARDAGGRMGARGWELGARKDGRARLGARAVSDGWHAEDRSCTKQRMGAGRRAPVT